MYVVGSVIAAILQLYLVLLFLRMIISWISVLNRGFAPKGLVLIIFEVVYTLTDKPIKFFRRFIPNLRIGYLSFDLGYMAVFLLAIVAIRINNMIFF